MTAAPYMRLYIADYLGDTMHLTTEQHGAYLLLLMAMWRVGGSLPNDPGKLARIARVHPRRWPAMCGEVMAFFTLDGDQIRQKRLSEEYQKCVSISHKRSANASRSNRSKPLKTHDQGLANAEQMQVQMPTNARARHIPDIREEERSPSGDPKKRRGSRLPQNWVLPLDDEAWALEQGMTRERVARTATRFKNHWLAKTGADAAKLDWSRTWQNWVLKDLERSEGNGHGKPKRRSTADLAHEFSEFASDYGSQPGEAVRLLPGSGYQRRGSQ